VGGLYLASFHYVYPFFSWRTAHRFLYFFYIEYIVPRCPNRIATKVLAVVPLVNCALPERDPERINATQVLANVPTPNVTKITKALNLAEDLFPNMVSR